MTGDGSPAGDGLSRTGDSSDAGVSMDAESVDVAPTDPVICHSKQGPIDWKAWPPGHPCHPQDPGPLPVAEETVPDDLPVGFLDITQILSRDRFENELAPNRNGSKHDSHGDVYGYIGHIEDGRNENAEYSYDGFVLAVRRFPELFNSAADPEDNVRELAAVFAHMRQETGAVDGLLFFREENGARGSLAHRYCNAEIDPFSPYECYEGQGYFGRGSKQLSYEFNYQPFGEWLSSEGIVTHYLNPERFPHDQYSFEVTVDGGEVSTETFFDADGKMNPKLLVMWPDLVSADPELLFLGSIWFWMTATAQKPSSHDVMSGEWSPDPVTDVPNGRLASKPFLMTTAVINGSVEGCQSLAAPVAPDDPEQGWYYTVQPHPGPQNRAGFYEEYLEILEPGLIPSEGCASPDLWNLGIVGELVHLGSPDPEAPVPAELVYSVTPWGTTESQCKGFLDCVGKPFPCVP